MAEDRCPKQHCFENCKSYSVKCVGCGSVERVLLLILSAREGNAVY